MLHLNVPLEKKGDMVDFDELVAWPGRGTHIALGRVIHEIKSGWAPPSLHVDLFRAQGCEPAVASSGIGSGPVTRNGIGSVFVSEHDRDHADGDGWVRRVGRVVFQVPIKIIDFEKDRVAFSLERAKVVLFMWVVGVTKVVKHRDGLDDAVDGLLAEGGDTRCHDRDATTGKALS